VPTTTPQGFWSSGLSSKTRRTELAIFRPSTPHPYGFFGRDFCFFINER
jgi:hypothetical protein